MTLPVSLPIASLGSFVPYKITSTPGQPASAQIQVVPLSLGSAVPPPLAGLVWPKKASLTVLLKGDGAGTLQGLFLAACHCETFQSAMRTKTAAGEPCLVRVCPGSTSGIAQDGDEWAGQALSSTHVLLGCWISSQRNTHHHKGYGGLKVRLLLLKGTPPLEIASLTTVPNHFP